MPVGHPREEVRPHAETSRHRRVERGRTHVAAALIECPLEKKKPASVLQELRRGMEQHLRLERRDRRELPARCRDPVNAVRFRELIRAEDDGAIRAPVAAEDLTFHVGDGLDLPAGQAHPPELAAGHEGDAVAVGRPERR